VKVNKFELGNRIRVIRQNSGKTMSEFGKIIDPENPASDSIVSRWEKGVSSPSPKRLKNIADFANVSVEYLQFGIKDLAGNELPTGDLSTYSSEVVGCLGLTNEREFTLYFFLVALRDSNDVRNFSVLRGFRVKKDETSEYDLYFEDCKEFDINHFLKNPKVSEIMSSVSNRNAVDVNSYLFNRQQVYKPVYYELFNKVVDFYDTEVLKTGHFSGDLFFIDRSNRFNKIENI
jgi:transcriptional regulator with XRE-family HTH domain